MKTVEILAFGFAILAFAYANDKKESLDNELAAALEAFIYSRGVDAGYLKRGDDGLADESVGDDLDDSLADALDSLGVDDDDTSDTDDDTSDTDDDTSEADDDDDRRALLSAFDQLALDAREANNGLTEDEQALINDLATLDDDTLQDLMDNRELLADDSGMSARSAKAKMASDLLISRLMKDHPDLRALAYGNEDSDPEDGAVLDRRGWFKKTWGKVKNFFKKVGDALKKLWNKWKKRVVDWLVKAGKALACKICGNPTPAPGMSWADFRTTKSKIKLAACAICRIG